MTDADYLALEPRTRHGEHIERFLDLDATEEDHGEVSFRQAKLISVR
jgi:hypothetical protein